MLCKTNLDVTRIKRRGEKLPLLARIGPGPGARKHRLSLLTTYALLGCNTAHQHKMAITV